MLLDIWEHQKPVYAMRLMFYVALVFLQEMINILFL